MPRQNTLAPPALDSPVWSDTRGSSASGPIPSANTPGWSFGNFQQLPTIPTPNTYTGAVPTPPSDYASTSGVLPHDYYQMQQLMNQAGPNDPRLNQLLQLLYLQRQGRT